MCIRIHEVDLSVNGGMQCQLLPDPHRLRSPVVWKSVGGQYLGSGDGCTGSGGLSGCEALQALAMTSYGLDLSSLLSAQEPDFDAIAREMRLECAQIHGARGSGAADGGPFVAPIGIAGLPMCLHVSLCVCE